MWRACLLTCVMRGWLAAPHESQPHGSPVSSGAGSGTRTRGWLAALSETAGRSREVVAAAGRARSWLQPGASAQPTPNSSPAPTCMRTWMEPSAVAEPQDNRHSNGPRSWLVPCATAEPQAKRHRISEARVQCPESSERRLHLDLVTLMLATDEADHLTKYARDGMDSGRVRRVLKNPCQCTGDSRCCARQLPVAGVVEYCQRFHHLSEECQTHLISTSYETCGPAPTDKSTRTQWHLLGEPVCVSALSAILGVTPRTLYKRVHQAVDLRKGPWAVQPHAAPQQSIVNHFLLSFTCLRRSILQNKIWT